MNVEPAVPGVNGDAEDPDMPAEDDSPAPEPSWWHRDHPMFTSLAGFYTGLVFIILIPGLFGAILRLFVEQETSERLFPYVLLTLVVPLALLIPKRTRRFATYMWIGIVSTFVVVVGVAAIVLWIMVNHT